MAFKDETEELFIHKFNKFIIILCQVPGQVRKSAVKDAPVSDIKVLVKRHRKQTNQYMKKDISDYDKFFEGKKAEKYRQLLWIELGFSLK